MGDLCCHQCLSAHDPVTLGVGHSADRSDVLYDSIVRTIAMPAKPIENAPQQLHFPATASPWCWSCSTTVVFSAIVGSLAISMSTEMRLARNTDYDAQME